MWAALGQEVARLMYWSNHRKYDIIKRPVHAFPRREKSDTDMAEIYRIYGIVMRPVDALLGCIGEI